MAQTIRDEVIEELLQGYSRLEDLLGEDGLQAAQEEAAGAGARC